MASELDDLRSFMEQRFAAAYPDVDTSAGSVADVEIITPLITRLSPDPFDTDIEAFLQGRLKSEYPDLVIHPGEPIDDYAVIPNRIFLEPFRRQIEAVVRNQSLQDPTVLNDREADALAANYFATRQLGGYSIGVARLYYNAPRFSVVTPTNAVYTSDGKRFLPVENQAISADDMLFNQSGSLFYFDVVVRSEQQGDEYNIERNNLVGIEGLPEVVRVHNRTRFDEGAPRETTEEFLDRVQQELTEKSLVTFRGIRARLINLFDSVRSLSVIGYNDIEMERDVVVGTPGETYAFGSLTADTGASSIFTAVGGVANGVAGSDDFVKIGVAVGDVFRRVNLTSGTITDFTVTEIVSNLQVRVTPAPPTIASGEPFMILGPSRGQLTLSNIPGGIMQPETPEGTISIPNNQIHIGGLFDVFVRAGDPQSRTSEISAVRDAQPLHFGVDLESFGNESDEFIQITPAITGAATTTAAYVGPGDVQAIVYIKVLNSVDQSTPWGPAATDVGRYLELLGSDYGLYVIQAVGEELELNGEKAIPVTISTFDQHTQTNTVGISDHSSAYVLAFRVVEAVSLKARVRDRDNPQADFNGDSTGLGAEVGDSIVVENGSDAGIYSIRRILTSIGGDDVAVLDRDLTTTVTPSGAGDGSGLRYRLADELQLDLISPKVTKMPLGAVFPANDLQTVAGSSTVSAGGTSNFLLAGIEVGDTLEIFEGDNAGTYEILDPVAGTDLEVSPNPSSTGFNQSFAIYRAYTGVQRPLIRVESVELLDSADQPTGITVPYGHPIDARVLGTLANRAQGQNVESYQGRVVSTGLPLLTFDDLTVDFVAQRVVAGNRLEIFEGDSIGEYEIFEVAPGGNVNRLTVHPAAEGGRDFVSVETELHYQIGEPSVGILRMYFLEPTSVNVLTGLNGGRLQYEDGGLSFEFRYSQVQGRLLLPAPGSGDDDPRDLRVARSYSIGGGDFESILEITDTGNPDAYEAEILEGDLFEVQEQIQFRDSVGTLLKDLGVFGTPAGLRTVTGSNRVSIPSNSHIDFTQMGDLAGQTLAINSGPDEGVYLIEKVVDTKTLELSAVMVGTTLGIRGLEAALPFYDADIIDPGDGEGWLRDTTDSGQLPAIGEYVTIFEAGSTEPEGTYEVTGKDLGASRVLLDGFTGTLPVSPGVFTWLATDTTTPSGTLEQPFTIYNTVPTEVQVTQVATKAPDVTVFGTGAVQAGLVTFQGAAAAFVSVVRGDRLEILSGPNIGVYPVLSVSGGNLITVYSAHPFSSVSAADPYRVWAGVHGARRMVTVGPFEGSSGLVAPGESLIYRIRRPGLHRTSSTEMEDQLDAVGLYYVDLTIESMGPGDNRNLAEGTRLVPTTGLQADGYTYSVENNVLTFSMFEEVSLNFDRRFLPVGNSDLPENYTEVSGRNLQIRYDTSSTVQLIDDLLRSDSERPVNANPIARHFLPSFVFTQLVYTGGSSTQITGPEIEDYINNLGALDVLQVSDVEAFLTRRGATKVVHPITLVSVTHDINRDLIVERSVDEIGGAVVPYEGSARISSFFADLEEGLTITRQ